MKHCAVAEAAFGCVRCEGEWEDQAPLGARRHALASAPNRAQAHTTAKKRDRRIASQIAERRFIASHTHKEFVLTTQNDRFSCHCMLNNTRSPTQHPREKNVCVASAGCGGQKPASQQQHHPHIYRLGLHRTRIDETPGGKSWHSKTKETMMWCVYMTRAHA